MRISAFLSLQANIIHAQDEFSVLSKFYIMQSRITIFMHSCVKTSSFILFYRRFCFLFPFLFFVYPMPYSLPSFLNVTVLRYNIFRGSIQSNQQLTAVHVQYTLQQLCIIPCQESERRTVQDILTKYVESHKKYKVLNIKSVYVTS
jgi:hypothetical protein